MVVKATKKKKVIPKRPKTGLKAVPLDRGFNQCHWCFYESVDKNDIEKLCKEYVKKTFDKADASAILANPGYHFHMYSGRAAAIFWMNHSLDFDDQWAEYPKRVYDHYKSLIESGKEILAEKKASAAEANKLNPKRVQSPQELLKIKVNNTLGYNLDYLEDEWIDGKTTDVDLYSLFQKHDLKGAAAPHIKPRIQFMRDEYTAAYKKTDTCAVEAYSHLTKKEIKRRLDTTVRMLTDLDKIQAAAKAVRKPRKPKARTADKQIKTLKYLKEDNTYKLVSVDPIGIPGTYRLYTFNVKTRELTEYFTTTTTGFEIKGTTIQNFDVDKSRKIRLRNPDAFLAIVLKKTPNQIDKEWSKLTTKTASPTGRINADTILLRVENK